MKRIEDVSKIENDDLIIAVIKWNSPKVGEGFNDDLSTLGEPTLSAGVLQSVTDTAITIGTSSTERKFLHQFLSIPVSSIIRFDFYFVGKNGEYYDEEYDEEVTEGSEEKTVEREISSSMEELKRAFEELKRRGSSGDNSGENS